MSNEVLYEAEEPIRFPFLVFLAAFGGIWFVLFGYGLLVTGEPFTLVSTIGSVAFGLFGCFLLVGILRGGSRYLQINDEAILWSGPLTKQRIVRHADVASFELLVPYGEGSRQTRMILKSGAALCLPGIGDESVIHQLLLTKWHFQGTRHI